MTKNSPWTLGFFLLLCIAIGCKTRIDLSEIESRNVIFIVQQNDDAETVSRLNSLRSLMVRKWIQEKYDSWHLDFGGYTDLTTTGDSLIVKVLKRPPLPTAYAILKFTTSKGRPRQFAMSGDIADLSALEKTAMVQP